jgi:hypothetical protein
MVLDNLEFKNMLNINEVDMQIFFVNMPSGMAKKKKKCVKGTVGMYIFYTFHLRYDNEEMISSIAR